MSGLALPTSIGVTLLLLVGPLAVIAERRSAEARWFALVNLLLAASIVVSATAQVTPESEPARALLYGRVAYGIAGFAFAAFYFQLGELARDTTHASTQRLRRLVPVAGGLSALLGLLCAATPWVVAGVYWRSGRGPLPRLGAAMPVVLVVVVLLGAWAVALVASVARHGSPRRRRQVLWLGVGVLLFDWFGLALIGLVLQRMGVPSLDWSSASIAAGSAVMLGGMVLTRQRELDRLSPGRLRESPSGSTLAKSCRACVTCGAMLPAHVEMAHCPLDGGAIQAGVDPWPGRTLDGRFTVGELLGSGGMGRVYRAEHLHLGGSIALKLLNADLAADRRKVARFVREARAAMRIRSPHVVTVHDLGELPPGIPFLTMEFIAGESLADRLSLGKRLTPAAVALLGRQLAEGLAAAHAEGVIHRDLKPDNVIVTRDGERELAKIVDFGLAKIVDEETATADLTTLGRVFGTPAYLSPEQASGRPAEARSDVYALGVILYRARAGRKPFEGTPLELLARHIGDPPPPLGATALDQLILSLMAKDPTSRPDARTLVEAFASLAGDGFRLTTEPLPAAAVVDSTPTIDESNS